MAREFEYRHVTVRIAGKSLTGLRGIKYNVKTEKELLHGRGNKAIGIQSGNESCGGEIKLLQWELEALIAAVKLKDPTLKITDISFDIIVTYQDGVKTVNDIIKGAEFEEFEKGFDQGDKFMEISLKFLCLDIEYNRA